MRNKKGGTISPLCFSWKRASKNSSSKKILPLHVILDVTFRFEIIKDDKFQFFPLLLSLIKL